MGLSAYGSYDKELYDKCYKLLTTKSFPDYTNFLNIIKEGGSLKNEKNYIVQSIVFKNMSVDECIKFCIEHKYKYNKVDYKKNGVIRIRQYTPSYLKTKGYNEYTTHKINNNISLIIVYK
jgi:hypothetical protein